MRKLCEVNLLGDPQKVADQLAAICNEKYKATLPSSLKGYGITDRRRYQREKFVLGRLLVCRDDNTNVVELAINYGRSIKEYAIVQEEFHSAHLHYTREQELDVLWDYQPTVSTVKRTVIEIICGLVVEGFKKIVGVF